MGIQCALCHSTVDNSFAPGIGKRLDGWANRDLNVGAIVSLAPNLKPFTDLLAVDVATSCEPTRLRCTVHEQTHARPSGADHLRERLLAYLRYDGRRLTILPEIHHQEENSCQTFFARIGGPIKRISSRSAALTGFGLRYTAARDNCNNAHCGVTGKSLRPASTFLIRSGRLIS
jgi:hypothetical protein